MAGLEEALEQPGLMGELALLRAGGWARPEGRRDSDPALQLLTPVQKSARLPVTIP